MKKSIFFLVVMLAVFFISVSNISAQDAAAITLNHAGTITTDYPSSSLQMSTTLYVGCTITNAVSAGINLYNRDLNTWDYTTWSLTDQGNDYWDVTITGLENYYYSFDVWAKNFLGQVTLLMWSKMDYATSTNIRKYVKFNCASEEELLSLETQIYEKTLIVESLTDEITVKEQLIQSLLLEIDSLTSEKQFVQDEITLLKTKLATESEEKELGYRILYLNKAPYYTSDMKNLRIFDHDQWSSNGGNDIFMMGAHRPEGNEKYSTSCAFHGIYYDDDSCFNPVTVNSFYYHLWTTGSGQNYGIGWNNQQFPLGQPDEGGLISRDFIIWTNEGAKEKTPNNYNMYGQINNWYLQAGKVVCSSPITFENIYDFSIIPQTGKLWSNDKFISFIIINPPEDIVLQNLDSDFDGVSDYDELFIRFSDPFYADTDGDGINDFLDTRPNYQGMYILSCDFTYEISLGKYYFKDISQGDIISWNWDFGDGETSTLKNPQHVYISPGTYTITLTITDYTGKLLTKEKTIVVSFSEYLDQSQSFCNSQYPLSFMPLQQTFTPTVSKITKIMVNIKKGVTNYYKYCTLSLVQGNTVLTSLRKGITSIRDGWNTFDIIDTDVTPGTIYKIQLSVDFFVKDFYWRYISFDVYTRGMFLQNSRGDTAFSVYGF